MIERLKSRRADSQLSRSYAVSLDVNFSNSEQTGAGDRFTWSCYSACRLRDSGADVRRFEAAAGENYIVVSALPEVRGLPVFIEKGSPQDLSPGLEPLSYLISIYVAGQTKPADSGFSGIRRR